MQQKLVKSFVALLLFGMLAMTTMIYFPDNYFTQFIIASGYQESGLVFNSNLDLDIFMNKSCAELRMMVNFSKVDNEKLFVIVPFRDREEHKKVFMDEMTLFLDKKVKSSR